MHARAGGEGAWASLNPIGGPPSRHFASSLRIGGTEYVYSMLGDDVKMTFDIEAARK